MPARALHEVAEQVSAHLVCPVGPGPDAAAGVVVSGVTLSSRTVRPGDLYAALPGGRVHGADFVDQAQAAGAVAVLTDADGARRAAGCTVPLLVVEEPRARLGPLAAWLYGRPAERLQTLAVTGTNGKTTTTFLLDGALRSCGRRTGLVGTVALRVGEEEIAATGTTPEAPDLHALLAVMVEHHVEVCSMEISSHALDQRRVDGLTVDVAGFTNLSQDHLDYHGDMPGYYAAKARLFTPTQAHHAVVCVDDEWGHRLAEEVEVPVTTVGVRTSRPAPRPARHTGHWQVLEVDQVAGVALLSTPVGDRLPLSLPLPGDFNVANAVLAVAMLVEAGLAAEEAATAVARAGEVPGRMERIGPLGLAGEPLAVVDYAHTPDAVAVVIAALRSGAKPLVIVLGAGGDRDRGKRPAMGAAAAAADVIVVTDDNPRSEDPAAIRAALLAGAREAAGSSGAEVLEVAGRRAAVTEAVRRAWTADGSGVVLLAGKGHERGQEVAGRVLPFDDRRVLAEVLAEVGRATRAGTDTGAQTGRTR